LSLFVEDLETFLQQDVQSGILIDDIVLILLLFADDMAIIGKTPTEVQYLLNKLYQYCDSWGLKVNVEKTKIMVFRKRGGLLESEHWHYNGHQIEVVNAFNYLGNVFNYTGNFNLNQEHLVGKALKAMNVLLSKCNQFDLKPRIYCQLFDAFVGSTLNYAAETWGYSKATEIERIHLKFCKRILNVKPNTCNATVYGELGRYPLYVNRYIRMLNYWFKLVSTENIILKKVYEQSLNNCSKGHRNWVYHIKLMLENHGFADVFNNVHTINPQEFVHIFKQRVIDTFKQEWFGTLEKSSVLEIYMQFKQTLEYEMYLDVLPKSLRFYFCRLRMSAHPLRIQSGRYARNNTPRQERYCLICNTNDIEDEYHFVCVCSRYQAIRTKYIKSKYYIRPSVYKYLELLKSSNRAELIKISLFIKESLTMRSENLNARDVSNTN